MHAIRPVKSHEVMHRRGDEFAATRNAHVGVSVGYNSISVRVDDFSVHARVMVHFFL